MDHFESIISTLLEADHYWVRRSFKVTVTKEEKRQVGKHSIPLCANMSETGCPSTITVGRGKKSHFDKHEQDKLFLRCVGSFGA